LAERDPDAIRPARSLLVDEVPEGRIGGSGATVERLAELTQLASDRVVPKGDPQLPHTIP
jgi:hypothetical protein